MGIDYCLVYPWRNSRLPTASLPPGIPFKIVYSRFSSSTWYKESLPEVIKYSEVIKYFFEENVYKHQIKQGIPKEIGKM